MNAKLILLLILEIIAAIPSVILLIYILDNRNAGKNITPDISLLFWLSVAVCFFIGHKILIFGRKPKDEQRYKDL